MASASVLQSESATGFFPRLARWCEQQVSRPGASVAAIAFVVLWFVSGPLYGWSNAWQLIVNTTSSIITLVMVFLIQHTQRRDTQAIQLKLDELIRVNSEARNELISLEAKPETAVEEIREAFDELRDVMVAYLETLGYQSLQAASGHDALELLTDAGGSVDVLLADYAMPGMSGADLARTVGANWPELPVVVITGSADTTGLGDQLHDTLLMP